MKRRKRVAQTDSEDVFRVKAGDLEIIGYGRSNVSVDGEVVQGWVVERLACQKCNATMIYHEEFDAHFCPECNEWQERACSDPECEFCSKRPPHPLKGPLAL
jgi:hypothetical protein